MNYKKSSTTKIAAPAVNDNQRGAEKSAGSTPADGVMERALRQASLGHFEKALDLLTTAGKNPRVLNARGVCLLRLGRSEAAIRVFRELLLNPGSTWMRSDLPTLYKANYATALLLGGHPSGCLEILKETRDDQHPTVQRLRTALAKWEGNLSLWQRLNWRFGKIEPSGRPVELDFAPGEFDEPIQPT